MRRNGEVTPMSREMSFSLPVFSSVNSLLLCALFLLWLPWHFFLLSSLLYFPSASVSPCPATAKTPFPNPSPLYILPALSKAFCTQPMSPFHPQLRFCHSLTLLFLIHLCSFSGLVFIVQLLEVLALVSPVVRVPPLHVSTYIVIPVHADRYSVCKYSCRAVYEIYCMYIRDSKPELINLSLGIR